MNNSHRFPPRFVATAIVLLATGGLIAMAGVRDGARADDLRVELSKATGAIAMSNSHAGRAVVRARNLAPGQSSSGRVRLAVNARAVVSLSATRIRSRPSLGGHGLARALTIRVVRVGETSARNHFYQGRLAGLNDVKLGRWEAGEGHHYEIVVRLPSTVDDSLQGGRARFRLVWHAVA